MCHWKIWTKKLIIFKKDITKLWNHIADQTNRQNDRISVIEDKIEGVDFTMAVSNVKVLKLEREKDILKDELVYIQAQTMRNNLLFINIPEARGEVPESQSETELKLREFLESKMKIAEDVVKNISFERVHRIGKREKDKDRSIVANFVLFKERELVRKQGKALEGTNCHVLEQFSKEIADKRKSLLPKLSDAKRNGHRAWLSYDKLYIDGKVFIAESNYRCIEGELKVISWNVTGLTDDKKIISRVSLIICVKMMYFLYMKHGLMARVILSCQGILLLIFIENLSTEKLNGHVVG